MGGLSKGMKINREETKNAKKKMLENSR